MKNTLLWSVLFTLAGTQVHAAANQPGTTPSSQPPNAMQQTPSKTTPPGQAIPPVNPATAPTATINCEYKIPPETKTIDQSIVLKWASKAVTQAFEFDSKNLDAQLQKLQACFTEQGWTGFNTALQKSGNLEAIKSQKLTVSSQVDGQVVITEAKENQWKLNLPLQVVYQNDKEKVTQLLSVDLTVGRKITGDLGISQMIAAPRGTVTQKLPPDYNPNAATVMNPNIETITPSNSTTTTTPSGQSTPSTSTPATSPGAPTTTAPSTPGQPAPTH